MSAAPLSRGAAPGGLKIVSRKMDDLQPHPKNPRRHDKRNIDAIKESLTSFGQLKPIVVWQGFIVAGNGTFTAARELGWKNIQIVDVSHLEEEKAKAFLVADNKTTDLSEFDWGIVAELLGDIQQANPELITATGLGAEEVEPLLSGAWNSPPEPVQRAENGAAITLNFSSEEWDAILDVLDSCGAEGETPETRIINALKAAPARRLSRRRA